MADKKKRLDPITYEILRHKLWAINDEQAMTLMRCSCSNVANDIKDMNCGLLTADGEMFSLGTYIAMHALTMSFITKDILKEYKKNPGINPGDMFICNDPYIGACHQNDVALMQPIFWENELIMWAGACLHVRDVGGATISSIQVGANDIYGEQPLIPPVKIIERGVIRKDIEREYLRRSRVPHKMALDLRAKIAANLAAERRIYEVIKRRGLETLMTAVNQMIDTAEVQFREKLKRLPEGMWAHRGYLDSNEEIFMAMLEMTKKEDKLIFDFTKSGKQAPAIMNTPYPGMVGRTLTAVLALLCYDIGWCPAGVMRAIEIKSKPGTVVHSEWPGGCCKATTAGAWEVDNLVSACIAKLLAASEEYHKYFQAGWMGAQATDHISGIDQRGERYQEGILDSMFGGTGARSNEDGIDTGGFLCSISLAISNTETYEYLSPILYLYRKQLADSGGPGTYRGGATCTALYTMSDLGTNIQKVTSSTGVSHPATSGIYGGFPSSTNQFAIKRSSDIRKFFEKGIIPDTFDQINGELEQLGENTVTKLETNDVYLFVSTGGGGYGDPLERSPDLVLKDFVNSLVTREGARTFYGVEFSEDGKHVDLDKTNKRRQQIKQNRVQGVQVAQKTDSHGVHKARVNQYLSVIEIDGQYMISCRCGHIICKVDENYKEHVIRKDLPITKAGMHIDIPPHVPDKKFMWREFYCPQCALLLTNEVALEEDPVVWEVKPLIH